MCQGKQCAIEEPVESNDREQHTIDEPVESDGGEQEATLSDGAYDGDDVGDEAKPCYDTTGCRPAQNSAEVQHENFGNMWLKNPRR